MVLLKLRCPPENRRALVAVSVSTSSPTLSLGAPEDTSDPFRLVINLRIAETTQPGRAITICTYGTVFAPADPDEGLDTLARGTVGGLISTSDAEKKISLGHFKPHQARRTDEKSPDLKERDWLHFLTIPGDGTAVQVAHDMPLSRIFRYEDMVKREDVRPGESYKLQTNPDYTGTTWWCWGALEDDLKDRKLSAWQEGINFDRAEKPDPDKVEKEGWVLGGNPAELTFEDQTGPTEFQFVE
ncbi:MAG: hypothetical protein M4579_005587 [Chaenotheca gracillima]|nr:MAG: hypothetical protein M4579_005587 [Chaenotheca gracillima]